MNQEQRQRLERAHRERVQLVRERAASRSRYDITTADGRRLEAALADADLQNAQTREFLDNIDALCQDGYRGLGLALLDDASEAARTFAAAAAKDQRRNGWRP